MIHAFLLYSVCTIGKVSICAIVSLLLGRTWDARCSFACSSLFCSSPTTLLKRGNFVSPTPTSLNLDFNLVHLDFNLVHLVSNLVNLDFNLIYLDSILVHLDSILVHLDFNLVHLDSNLVHLDFNLVYLLVNFRLIYIDISYF